MNSIVLVCLHMPNMSHLNLKFLAIKIWLSANKKNCTAPLLLDSRKVGVRDSSMDVRSASNRLCKLSQCTSDLLQKCPMFLKLSFISFYIEILSHNLIL